MESERDRRAAARLLDEVDLTVSLPADIIAALEVALFQRRSLGDDSAAMTDLVRQAVSEWLDRELDRPSKLSIRI